MLRILEVGGGLPGWAGTEKYVLDLSRALHERGHRVAVGCADGSGLAERVDRLQIPRVALEMRHEMDWRQLVSHLRAMRGRYDVVNIHGYRDYIVPAVAARLARVPAVVMTRHLPHAFRSHTRARLCSRVFYDKIIAVSHFVQGVLLASGVPAERIAVVHNGVTPRSGDNGEKDFRDEFNIPRNAFLIATAGRLEPQKGFEILVQAMRNIDGHCVICGPGDRSALEKLVADFGLTDRVHLPGFRADVARLWTTADVIVVPSISPETFSYVAIEALSAGKPVVASRIGGIPEVCDDECAMLVTPGDAEELASAIGQLAASNEQRSAMGAAGSLRAKNFTIERMADGVERVYRAVLEGRPCATP